MVLALYLYIYISIGQVAKLMIILMAMMTMMPVMLIQLTILMIIQMMIVIMFMMRLMEMRSKRMMMPMTKPYAFGRKLACRYVRIQSAKVAYGKQARKIWLRNDIVDISIRR